MSTDIPQYTLPSEFYHSPDHYSQEQEQIFKKSWLLVGHRNCLLPQIGSFRQVDVAGQSLVLARTGQDEFAAYYNVCPHRAHELVAPKSEGKLVSKAFVCPNHGWSFKVSSGDLVKARFSENVVDFCKGDFNLKKVHVQEQAGLVFVNLGSDDASETGDLTDVYDENFFDTLSKKIPGIADSNMRQLAEKETVINANWKVLVDNFLECYHCDIAHKAFVDMVDLNRYSTNVSPHHVIFESACKPDNKAYCFSKDDPIQSVFFCWLWPNSVVYSAPGSNNLSILQFIPLSPTTTLRRSERFAIVQDALENNSAGNGEQSEEALAAEKRVNYLNQVLLEEDTNLCESVQRGLQSAAYTRGRLMVSKGGVDDQPWHTEVAVAQFHNLVKHYTNTQQM